MKRSASREVSFEPDSRNQFLNQYHRIVVEAAKLAVEEGASVCRSAPLDELAEAVKDFLMRFLPFVERATVIAISEHIKLNGFYSSKPCVGPGRTLADLMSFWDANKQASLAYVPSDKVQAYAGEGPREHWTENLLDLAPWPDPDPANWSALSASFSGILNPEGG